mgnify:CR=1 FL=1
MPKKQNNSPNLLSREQLNTIIALLLVLIGEDGQKELLKKRRVNAKLVRYFSDQLGLSNKDLASIFNTTESGISNLKAKRK